MRWLILTVLLFNSSYGKIYRKCELAAELKFKHNLSLNDIKNFVCIAEFESTFKTDAINPNNPDGSKDYGLFQLNSQYWCGNTGSNGCNINCEVLLDEDISDDLACARIIMRDTTKWTNNPNGLTAWVVYANTCQYKNLDEYIQECLPELTGPRLQANEPELSTVAPIFPTGIYQQQMQTSTSPPRPFGFEPSRPPTKISEQGPFGSGISQSQNGTNPVPDIAKIANRTEVIAALDKMQQNINNLDNILDALLKIPPGHKKPNFPQDQPAPQMPNFPQYRPAPQMPNFPQYQPAPQMPNFPQYQPASQMPNFPQYRLSSRFHSPSITGRLRNEPLNAVDRYPFEPLSESDMPVIRFLQEHGGLPMFESRLPTYVNSDYQEYAKPSSNLYEIFGDRNSGNIDPFNFPYDPSQTQFNPQFEPKRGFSFLHSLPGSSIKNIFKPFPIFNFEKTSDTTTTTTATDTQSSGFNFIKPFLVPQLDFKPININIKKLIKPVKIPIPFPQINVIKETLSEPSIQHVSFTDFIKPISKPEFKPFEIGLKKVIKPIPFPTFVKKPIEIPHLEFKPINVAFLKPSFDKFSFFKQHEAQDRYKY